MAPRCFWKKIELPGGADDSYVCTGVKATNCFMPKKTLSEKGLEGGGWIVLNKYLQVETRDGPVWCDSVLCAVGDCNYGCIGSPMITYPELVESVDELRSSSSTRGISMPNFEVPDAAPQPPDKQYNNKRGRKKEKEGKEQKGRKEGKLRKKGTRKSRRT